MSKKVKISLWIVGSLIIAGSLAYLAIFTLSTRAVSAFREQAADQLNTAVSGEATGSIVELRKVWFGGLLNSDYEKVSGLQAEYEKLLSSVKGYVAVSNAHDALVENYNRGIKGDAPLSGDLLQSVEKYLAAMKNRFPDETDRITALENLSTKVASNTDFDVVSGDIDQLLHDNNPWLDELREKLNQQITEFQDRVNK
ncbi:hypothetical protein FWG95_03420 [Candidatus Saccharibacteria bacterium]|nr:hypothetical protein [Candidatus Saccharibacteria bacterium]